MEAHVLLADFAQSEPSGKVNALGLGWSVVGTPTPHHAIVTFFRVGWAEADVPHTAVLRLRTADRHEAVAVPTPSGEQPLRVEARFEVGRPEGSTPGSTLDHALAINVGAGLALAPGRYEWVLEIDGYGRDGWRAPFVVRDPTMSSG